MGCNYLSLPEIPASGTNVLQCVSELGHIGLENGLLPVLWQTITRINADLLSIEHVETNFSEILEHNLKILKEIHSNMSSARCHFILTHMCEHIEPDSNGRHFADIFKCIFLNENLCIYWNVFPRMKLIIFQHWIRSLGTIQVTEWVIKFNGLSHQSGQM